MGSPFDVLGAVGGLVRGAADMAAKATRDATGMAQEVVKNVSGTADAAMKPFRDVGVDMFDLFVVDAQRVRQGEMPSSEISKVGEHSRNFRKLAEHLDPQLASTPLWWTDKALLKRAYRDTMFALHPDRGGDSAQMVAAARGHNALDARMSHADRQAFMNWLRGFELDRVNAPAAAVGALGAAVEQAVRLPAMFTDGIGHALSAIGGVLAPQPAPPSPSEDKLFLLPPKAGE